MTVSELIKLLGEHDPTRLVVIEVDGRPVAADDEIGAVSLAIAGERYDCVVLAAAATEENEMSELKKLTFAEFQATRVWGDDLADWPFYWADKEEGHPHPGYAYEDGGCFIDRLPSGQYCLEIYDMSEVSDDLTALEQKLYRCGIEEGWWREGSSI